MALDIRREIESRQQEADGIRCQSIERALFEAELAEHHYMMVDPNNQLAADMLEADWNHKLRAVEQSREEYEHHMCKDKPISQAIADKLATLTTNFS